MYCLCNEIESQYLGGITSFFGDSLLTVEERSEENVKRFLLGSGFVESTPFVIDCLARLILASLHYEGKFVIEHEYERLTRNKSSKDALSLKLHYYILKNYSRMRRYIRKQFGFDMGKKCDGNKNFIRKLSSVYSVYCENTAN